MTDRDRITLETYRDARAAMALIREALEDCAPPGSVPREGYSTPEFTIQAEALVRGIYAITNRRRRNGDRVKSEPGPAATLGSVAGAGFRLIVWCRDCSHQVEPDLGAGSFFSQKVWRLGGAIAAHVPAFRSKRSGHQICSASFR